MTLIDRRAAREPVAYILGSKGFRRLELKVDPRVLVPRPETELLVEAALALPPGASVADVGTGSGAVALALADERPDLDVTGFDISADALTVARANGARLGLPVMFRQADLLDGGGYDAVVANLPYVAEAERSDLPPEITRYEPEVALFAGEDGLDLIRRLATALPDGVRSIALEIGAMQGDAVTELLARSGFAEVNRHRDLAGHRARGRRPTMSQARAFDRCIRSGGVALFGPTPSTDWHVTLTTRSPSNRLYALKRRPPEKAAAVMFFELSAALARAPRAR